MDIDNTLAPHELMPSNPIHPGEILKNELDARGITQKTFASILGLSSSAMNELINSRRPIHAKLALRLEAATNIKAYVWVELQAAYNLQMAMADKRFETTLKKIRKAAAEAGF
ncbi:MAG: HigA family addiction module antitoxin [Prevotellaceae bacterium]|nr:HigA family addiction module antitoxin [Prevotellaceae bacterium]